MSKLTGEIRVKVPTLIKSAKILKIGKEKHKNKEQTMLSILGE
jgi:hypothetical protein